jgi:hypothetical protein
VPPPIRELVRHRAKLVALRTGLKCQVHAVLAAAGVSVVMSDLFGVAGSQLLAGVRLAPAMRARVDSCLRPNRPLRLRGGSVHPTSPSASCAPIPAIEPSKPCQGWARCWPRSWSPRSARSADLLDRPSWLVGPGSRRVTTRRRRNLNKLNRHCNPRFVADPPAYEI